ncbi:MAG TPA: TIGR03435 family protein [Gammaproteobacteria bacterium]
MKSGITCVRAAIGAVVLLVSSVVLGQAANAGAAKPEFDVASVRLSDTLDPAKMMAAMQSGRMPRMGPHVDGLRAEYLQMTMVQLVANAYEVKPYQVSGPDWIKDVMGQRFDIIATMPEGSSKDDAPKMLRALLEERFKLEATKGMVEGPVYALVVGKGGPKLKESAERPTAINPEAPLKPGEIKMDGPNGLMIVTMNKDGSGSADMGERGKFKQKIDVQARTIHVEGGPATMQGMADMISQLTMSPALQSSGVPARQVVDQTGLKGYYEVVFELPLLRLGAPATGAASTEASDPTGGMSLTDSVEKMGLKLEPRKAPVLQVVVTHVEKTPTEN